MKKTVVEEQNKALVKRYIEAWNEGDFEALDEVLATDYMFYACMQSFSNLSL